MITQIPARLLQHQGKRSDGALFFTANRSAQKKAALTRRGAGPPVRDLRATQNGVEPRREVAVVPGICAWAIHG